MHRYNCKITSDQSFKFSFLEIYGIIQMWCCSHLSDHFSFFFTDGSLPTPFDAYIITQNGLCKLCILSQRCWLFSGHYLYYLCSDEFQAFISSSGFLVMFQSHMFMMAAGHFYVDANFFETVYPLTWQTRFLPILIQIGEIQPRKVKTSHFSFFSTIVTHWILALLPPCYNLFPLLHFSHSAFLISCSCGHNNLLTSSSPPPICSMPQYQINLPKVPFCHIALLIQNTSVRPCHLKNAVQTHLSDIQNPLQLFPFALYSGQRSLLFHQTWPQHAHTPSTPFVLPRMLSFTLSSHPKCPYPSASRFKFYL